MKPGVHFEKYSTFRAPADVDNATLPTAYKLADLLASVGMPVSRERVVLYSAGGPDIADVSAQTFAADAAAASADVTNTNNALHFGVKTQADDADGNRLGAILNVGQSVNELRLRKSNLLDALVQVCGAFFPAGTTREIIRWHIVESLPGLLSWIGQRVDNAVIPVVESDGGF